MKINLKSLTEAELGAFMAEQGQPPYRTAQLMQWMYERGATSIDEITVLSKTMRARLNELAYIGGLELRDTLKSEDGTMKLLFSLEDGFSMESVLIPEGERLTLCISSQVGCKMGCRFCRTAAMGFKRDLKAHEIVDQIVAVNRLLGGKRVSNIVFMGMGEPLMNLAEVVEAIVRINTFLKLSRRRISVSTCGLPQQILELDRMLAASGIYVNLAVSLNATNDAERDEIMPVNRKYPIRELMDAVRKFPLPRTRRITFEYVMVAGLNDSLDDAVRLSRLISGIPNKVNLIPLNGFEGCELKRPSDEHVEQFKIWLEAEGVTALIRKSKGQDILAACGMLAAGEGVPAPEKVDKEEDGI